MIARAKKPRAKAKRPKTSPARTLLERRVAFAEKYLSDSKGRPFRIKGREWVKNELWKSLDGYQAWPVDRERLCSSCAERAATLVLDASELEDTQTPEHAKTCAGLKAEPVLCTVLCIERRGGKTFNAAGYVDSSLFLESWKSFLYVAAAFGQAEALVLDNFRRPIVQHGALARRARILGRSIEVARQHTRFEFTPTSHKSITGRGRSMIIIDEARDIDSRVAAALLPSVLESHGMECPAGHMRHDGDGPPKCPVCSQPLRAWRPRILIMSSAGITGNADNDWFPQLVEHLEQHPDPNYRLIRMDVGANPLKSVDASNALERVFGQLPATSGFMAAELGNQFTRPGGTFLSEALVRAAVDRRLANQEGSIEPCVAFLDTSVSGDLTSLVITADEPTGTEPRWTRISVVRIDIWDPKLLAGGVIDERVVQAHLDVYVPLFPGLRKLCVDVRRMPWAQRLVMFCRQHRPGWGRKVEGFTGRDAERDASWAIFDQRVRSRTIGLPEHPVLMKELPNLRTKFQPDGRVRVVDANRRKSHADVSDGIAQTCLMVHLEQIGQRLSLGQTERKGTGADLLARLFQPTTRGLTRDSF